MKATGCIGRDTAIVFAVSGARGIILAYENVGDVENIDNLIVELEIVKTNINCVISPKNVNLADNILVQDMVSNVATNLERIDYVVHCAGVSLPFPSFYKHLIWLNISSITGQSRYL